MNEEQTKIFEDALKKELEKARFEGLSVGCKSVSQVIYDKIKNVDRNCSRNNLIRVIKDIKKFCEVGLAIKNTSITEENDNDEIADISTDTSTDKNF